MLRRIPIVYSFCLALAFWGGLSSGHGQSLTGNTGLATIPTARMQEDGTLSFGFSYFDKKHQQYFEGTKDFGAAYVNLTFLPFLEVVLRVNRPIPFHSTYTVDRFPMVRLRVVNEKKYLPAIALGINDFASTSSWGTVHFNATYLVMSKKVAAFDFHFGYAPVIMKALYYQLDGLFGGIAYMPHKSVNLFAEYDTRYVNAGIQYLFLKHFSINLATINFDSYAAGINFKVFLK
jgi:hypothetical protein